MLGNTEIKDGENVITVLVRNETTKKNSTYQITVNKQVSTDEKMDDNLNVAMQKANRIRAILLGIVAFIIIAIIVFFIAKQLLNREKVDDNLYDYDLEDKEKLNLEEEEELFKRVNKEKFSEKVRNDDIEIKQEDKRNEEIENRFQEEKNDNIEEKAENFFRTSKTKPRGKHF